MKNAHRIASGWLGTIALAIVAIGTSIAIYGVTKANDNTCEANAETRQAVIDVVHALGPDVPIDPEADQATKDRIAQTNKARADARHIVDTRLAPDLCADGKPPVSHS